MSQALIVDDVEFDVQEALQKTTLTDLFYLKNKCGIGLRSIMHALQKMETYDEPAQFLDDEVALQAFIAIIWLCKRYAGEKLSFDEAGAVQLDRLRFRTDDEDEVEPDPTSARTGSDPGDVPALPAATSTPY